MKFANSMRDSVRDVTGSQQKFLHLIALREFPSSFGVFLLDRVTLRSVNLLFASVWHLRHVTPRVTPRVLHIVTVS